MHHLVRNCALRACAVLDMGMSAPSHHALVSILICLRFCGTGSEYCGLGCQNNCKVDQPKVYVEFELPFLQGFNADIVTGLQSVQTP